jgi:hypothetical protein
MHRIQSVSCHCKWVVGMQRKTRKDSTHRSHFAIGMFPTQTSVADTVHLVVASLVETTLLYSSVQLICDVCIVVSDMYLPSASLLLRLHLVSKPLRAVGRRL